jgi:hypothetical protein
MVNWKCISLLLWRAKDCCYIYLFFVMSLSMNLHLCNKVDTQHKSISWRLRRKTKRDYCVTNKEIRWRNVSLFFAYKVFEKKPPPPQRNSKYMKQCSLFVIVPKSFFKVQIGNFKILVCNIKFFWNVHFFQCTNAFTEGGTSPSIALLYS